MYLKCSITRKRIAQILPKLGHASRYSKPDIVARTDSLHQTNAPATKLSQFSNRFAPSTNSKLFAWSIL
jgi:hypothetical protein